MEFLIGASAVAVLSGSLLLALGMARMARLNQGQETQAAWER